MASAAGICGKVMLSRNYRDAGGFGSITSTGPFRYTDRTFDQETGLYYNRARYYDPQIGRFISEDPIQFKGGIDFYAYTRNNPINLIDPKGTSCEKCIPRSSLNWYERMMLNAAEQYAAQSGMTTGFGFGASGSWAPMSGFPTDETHSSPGTNFSVSNMLVADGSGQSALVTTYTSLSLMVQNSPAAVQAGVQVSLGRTKLSPGWSGSTTHVSASYGAGMGVGFDVDVATGDTTLNFGVGRGAKVGGTPGNPTLTHTQLICPE